MGRMDASREQEWVYRELNTIGSDNYAFVLPVVSLNAKFIRILLLSMSATFCTNPGVSGRLIFGHVSITSTVANSNVIAYPCFISKLIRASKMAKPPSGNPFSTLWQPTAASADSGTSCNNLFPSVVGNSCRCEPL